MPLRVATNRRRKIARLSFRKKRNNITRRKLKHRRYDKTPKTTRPIYSGGGGLLGSMSGKVNETIYDIDDETRKGNESVKIYENAFDIQLSRGMLSATFGGNYTLKIEIDMSKYKHDTKKLVSELFLKIFGDLKPEEFDFNKAFDFDDLVTFDKVRTEFNELKEVNKTKRVCQANWNKLVFNDDTRKPKSKCVVTFEFKIKKNNAGIEFTSISFTAIKDKFDGCLAYSNERIRLDLPGYVTINTETQGVSISKPLTEEGLSNNIRQLNQLNTPFNVCVLYAWRGVIGRYYGFNENFMNREDVKTAVESFKASHMKDGN
jgi:hypothetical protein